MNGKQHAVLWLGLILILVRLMTTGQFSAIWQNVIANAGPVNVKPGKNTAHVPQYPIGVR